MSTHSSPYHIIPFKTYITVFTALLVLTVVTVAISFVDLGSYNLVIAMLVASIKASLVAMFFMHLYYDNKLNLIIFLISILFLAIFIIFIMFDTMTRDNIYKIKADPINPSSKIYDNQKSSKGGTGH
jgi:cytochrome c oxidase subunit IV